jgi:hypothetical protein
MRYRDQGQLVRLVALPGITQVSSKVAKPLLQFCLLRLGLLQDGMSRLAFLQRVRAPGFHGAESNSFLYAAQRC